MISSCVNNDNIVADSLAILFTPLSSDPFFKLLKALEEEAGPLEPSNLYYACQRALANIPSGLRRKEEEAEELKEDFEAKTGSDNYLKLREYTIGHCLKINCLRFGFLMKKKAFQKIITLALNLMAQTIELAKENSFLSSPLAEVARATLIQLEILAMLASRISEEDEEMGKELLMEIIKRKFYPMPNPKIPESEISSI